MLLSNRSRRGFSLTEVIVALFIMALGIISLLTLFPLGAVQMGKALRDDRSQTTAVLADGKMRLLWDFEPTAANPPLPPQLLFAYNSQFITSMTSPASGPVPGSGLASIYSDVTSGPMYPILCDPIGVQSYAASLKRYGVAANALADVKFKRINITGLNSTNDAANFLTMPDDLTFGPGPLNGNNPASPYSEGEISRQGRFNFAYILQVPNFSAKSVCDMKVLVFDRRIPGINPTTPNNELVMNRDTPASAIQLITSPTNPAPLVITPLLLSAGLTQLTFTGVNHGLRNGAWLMDGTIGDPTGVAPPPTPTRAPYIRTANFYRVLSVEEDLVNNVTIVDLETAWKSPTSETDVPGYRPTIYYFRELIDVYDRPALTRSTYSNPTP